MTSLRALTDEDRRYGCHCVCSHFGHVGVCTGAAEVLREFGIVTVPLCLACDFALGEADMHELASRGPST